MLDLRFRGPPRARGGVAGDTAETACATHGPMSLTGKQRRYLRGLGHELKPIVQVGKGGVDDGLVAAVDQALADHELIKLKIGESANLDRHEAADAIAVRTKSEVAQVLGNTVLLFRPDPEDPKITLPRAKTGDAEDTDDANDASES